MSQTDALAWRVSQEFKTEFGSIGPESLNMRVSRKCQRTMMWIGEGRCLCVRVCVCKCVHVCIYDGL